MGSVSRWLVPSAFALVLFAPDALAGDFSPPPMPFVVSLASDSAGHIWVGTEDHGVFRFDPAAQNAAAWTNFTTKDGLGDDNAYAICADKLGRIWVGHLNHGVSVYNGEGWKNYDVLDGPIGERVFSIAADPVTGDIWIATSAGLTRYSVDRDKWSFITRAEGLPSDQIQSLTFDSRGNIYAGTQCDGLAVGRPPLPRPLGEGRGEGARSWTQISGPDSAPLTPAGAGLPSNLINQVLVSRNGTIYVATTCGLAASKDGKRWQFVRGSDWAAKVKGLYGGARGWRETRADFTLTEDYCTCLAEDDAGRLWIGHWRTGYEVIDPQHLQRVYTSTPEEAGTPPNDKIGKPGNAPNPAYVFTILTRPSGPPLIGWYGHALSESVANAAVAAGATGKRSLPAPSTAPIGEFGTAHFGKPKLIDTPKLPSPAAPPTLDELNAMLSKLGNLPTLKTLSPTVVAIPDDWRTQGDWLGRYGRYWACCCAMCSPEDYIWGAGREPIQYAARIGPHHEKDDSTRYWVHWLYTSDPRSLEMPPTYFDSRVKKGLTAREKNRRQSEWDDHGEAYAPTHDGPDLWCALEIPAGQFYLSLYDFNKDGHQADNCLRDYRVVIRSISVAADFQSQGSLGRLPTLAAARIHNFWDGVWTRFYVQGPIHIAVQLQRGASKNTILAGLTLDPIGERPSPYFSLAAETAVQAAKCNQTRALLLGVTVGSRAAQLAPQATEVDAAEQLFKALNGAEITNTANWAAQCRLPYTQLGRFYRRAAALQSGSLNVQRASTACEYQLRLFKDWEDSLHQNEIATPRDIEKALRWDGYAETNSRSGFQNVVRFLSRKKAQTIGGN